MARAKRLATRRVYDGKVLSLDVDDVEEPGGVRAVREVVRHRGSVAALAVHEDGRVVLVRQYRYPVDAEVWELPAGRLDAGETAAAGARRELEEEAGLRAGRIEPMAVFYTTPGFCDEAMHLFRASQLEAVPPRPEADERIEILTCSLDEARAMISRGEVREGKTLVALLLESERRFPARVSGRGRTALWLLASAALLLGLLAFGLFPQDGLRTRLERRIGAAISGRATIGRLHVTPLTLSAELDDVVLEAPGWALQAPHVRVLAERGVLAGRIVLESLEVSSPRLEARPATATATTRTAALPPVTIRQLRISGGSVRYRDASRGDVTLGAIAVSGGIGIGTLGVRANVAWERPRPLRVPALTATLQVSSALDVRVATLDAATATSHLTMSGTLARAGVFAPDLTAKAEVDLSEAAAFVQTDARGRLQVTARLTGTADAPHLDASAEGHSLVIRGWPVTEARARLSGSRVEATASAAALDVQRIAREAGLAAPVTGTLSAELRASGELGGPLDTKASAVAHVTANGVALDLQASATGPVRLDERSIDLAWMLRADGGAALHGEASGRAAGRYPPEIDARLAGNADLAALIDGASGRAAFSLDARGPIQKLSGSGHLEGEGLAWRDVAVGPASLSVVLRDGAGELSLLAPEWHVSAQAELPLSGPYHATIEAHDTPFERLRRWLPEALPPDRTLSGSAALSIPRVGPRRLAVESLRLEARGMTLDASGSAGLEETVPIDLAVRLAADLAELPLPEGWSVAGRLQGDMKLAGSRAQPRLSGLATTDAVAIQGPSLPPLAIGPLRVEIANDTLVLPATRATLAGGSLTFSGRMPLESRTGELHVEWSGLAAEELLARIRPLEQSPLQASLSGRADLAGDVRSLGSLRGRAQLDGGPVGIQDLTLDLSPATLVLEKGRLSTDGLTARSDGGAFTVMGGLDLERRSLDVTGRGSLDLRALSPFVASASLGGVADFDVRVDGPFGAPRPTGSASVRNGSLRLRDIPEALTEIQAGLVFDGARARIDEARASLGGGEVRATGDARLSGAGFDEVAVKLTARGLALRYPAGLRSRLDAELALTGAKGALQLSGDVAVQRGFYDVDEASRAPLALLEQEPSPLLRSIALDVRIAIDSPILIRNKLASLDVDGRLQLTGDLATPAPFGRLDLRRGGKIYVRGRDFTVQSGRLAYEGNWNPRVSLLATRQIRDTDSDSRAEPYDVELSADGPLDTLQPTLRVREGGLSETQAAALVATGSSRSGASLNLGAQLAGEQAAGLLLGKLSQSIGLDQVAVQPELLALETDPGARFTFGKQLSSVFSLIYSLGLGAPEQRFARVEARAPHAITLKGQRTDSGIYSLAVGQRLRSGGARRSESPKDNERVRVSGVRFEGDSGLPEQELHDALRAKPGKQVSAWAIQEDADRLREHLVDRGFIEAQVGGRFEQDEAVFSVRSGPHFEWQVAGMADPPDLGAPIRAALFEEEALENGRKRLLEALAARGYLRGSVVTASAAGAATRSLRFTVTLGPRLEATVAFPGARLFSEAKLLALCGGPAVLLRSPQDAARAIEAAYRTRERLAAHVGAIEVEDVRPGLVSVVVPVSEGAPALLASLRFEGAARPEPELIAAAAVPVGSPFSSEAVAEAVERLRAYYFGLGHARVQVRASTKASGADVDVAFAIAEGERVEIGAIEIRGLGHARESLVRARLRLKPGDPLDPRRLAAAERRLLDLGIFAGAAVTASDENPATITVALTEDVRLTGSYELRWSDSSATTSQGTAIVDGELRDIAGRGIRAGARQRVGGDVRETRGSLYAPTFGRASLTLAVFQLAEDLQATDIFTGEPFTNVRTQKGVQLQQALPMGRRWQSFVGYRVKRVFSTAFPDPIDVASLDFSLAWDTRDNPLDARKGHFMSASLDLAPRGLGSDIRFVKGFAQVFLTRPLTPKLAWAHAYRLGLAQPFEGQELIFSERFEAGGANSVRGFATDSIGPSDVFGDPEGGNAVLVFNQELRYRFSSRFGSALFYDAGNVFKAVGDLGFDLRHAVGAGFRWNSPVGLLRFDLGFPLARREGERAYRFHFALGQSF